jgi:hypothetical protein
VIAALSFAPSMAALGTTRTSWDVCCSAAIRGKADIEQTALGTLDP